MIYPKRSKLFLKNYWTKIMTKLTYSDSPFFSNWSQTYFTNLTLDQHIANNNWLMNTLTMLKDDGVLYVPVLDKKFNRLGEEV